MKKLSLLSLLLACTTFLFAQYNTDNLSIDANQIGDQLTYGKLKLYPIVANDVFHDAHKSIGEYTPLNHAIREGKVIVAEWGSEEFADNSVPFDAIRNNVRNFREENGLEPSISDNLYLENRNNAANGNYEAIQRNNYNDSWNYGAEVNSLYIENTSQDTVFLMAGEVVKGGMQDRVLAQDMILVPNSGPVDLSVYCVEEGRWDESNGTQFNETYMMGGLSMRKVADVDKNQQAMWDEVASINSKQGTATSTGTYTAVTNNPELKAELDTYVSFFKDAFINNENVVGVIAVSGEEILVCDIFATHDLFAKAYPSLLESYALEALNYGSDITVTDTKVNAYLTRILGDESKADQKIVENGKIFENKGKKLHITTY